MEFGTFSFTILGKYKKVFRSPKTHTNNFWGYKKFLDPLKTHTNNFGGIKRFLDPQNTH